QTIGESGGWPLSMFLTPDGKPIFGGTYWPPEDKVVNGETYPGFKSVLKRVTELVGKDREGLYKQADKVAELTTESMERMARSIPLAKLDRELVASAVAVYDIDREYGGLGGRCCGDRGQ